MKPGTRGAGGAGDASRLGCRVSAIVTIGSRESFGIPRASSEKGFIILTAALESVFRQAMTLPTIAPIREEDLPGFCSFLSEHLSRDRSPEEWAKAFRQNWCPGKPNNGFLLRADGRIVGGI